MKNARFLIAAAAIPLLPSTACAQELTATDDYTVALEDDGQIVVTASGIEQSRAETGHAISVITQEDLERTQVTSISDALRTVPGVAVARSGPVGGQTSVFIRGGDSSQTLVLIDGVRINDPSTPNAAFDFGALLTDNIGRVEVLRGANSVIWGSQAIGGVINIQSIAPTEALAVSARAEYGSHDTGQAVANVSGKSGIVSGSVGAGYYRTDGISALVGGTEKDGYKNFSANGKLLVELSPAFALDLRGYYNKGRIEYDDAFAFPGAPADSLPESDNEQFVGYVGINHDLIGGKWKGRLSYSRTDLTREGTEVGAVGPFNFNTFTARGIVDRFAYDGNFSFSDHIGVIIGALHEKTFASTFFPLGGDIVPTTAKTDFNAVYGQLTLRPVEGLTLNGGVRYEDNSQYGGETTFAGNMAYSPNDGRTVFRGSYAEGFRAPTLTEALPPFGNINLQPEKSKGFDLGVEHSFIDGKLTATATYYSRKIDNAIIFSFNTFQSENIAKVKAEGIELGLAIHPTDNLNVSAQYSLVDATSRTPDANFGNRLARRPTDSASFAIDWKSPLGFSLGSTITLTGDSFDNLSNITRVDGYCLASVRAALPISDNFEVYGRVENLFDKDYAVVSGYNTYGRTAAVGVRARF